MWGLCLCGRARAFEGPLRIMVDFRWPERDDEPRQELSIVYSNHEGGLGHASTFAIAIAHAGRGRVFGTAGRGPCRRRSRV